MLVVDCRTMPTESLDCDHEQRCSGKLYCSVRSESGYRIARNQFFNSNFEAPIALPPSSTENTV